ncbi:hypothetical protein LH464_04360 [Neorhizobium sp. T786]|uniref:phage head-tail joining protein n=1 Tax=Pseudorhizobium xiangyangii TaxID=2883104 RepID=UPI001CFF76AD|nr:hypothetical protein [Neorhizobium xiangyangii]MCB5201711.1 hypothetical protein [Neorhizobium xiangyangii]
MAVLSEEELDALRAQRVKLVKAMRSGALSVQHGDKRVQYRSLAEMQAALDGIDEDIAEGTGKKRKRVFYIDSSRGF